MANDLVEYTLDMCDKPDEGTSRFPARYYNSYVKALVDSAISIHRHVCYANAVRSDRSRRQPRQEAACAECTSLEHLIMIAHNKGWISSKQHETWQNKICNLHYVIINWMMS